MTSAARDARAARCGVWSIAWLASLFRKRLLHMIERLSEAATHLRTHPTRNLEEWADVVDVHQHSANSRR